MRLYGVVLLVVSRWLQRLNRALVGACGSFRPRVPWALLLRVLTVEAAAGQSRHLASSTLLSSIGFLEIQTSTSFAPSGDDAFGHPLSSAMNRRPPCKCKASRYLFRIAKLLGELTPFTSGSTPRFACDVLSTQVMLYSSNESSSPTPTSSTTPTPRSSDCPIRTCTLPRL